MKASEADAVAIGMARRATYLMPQRFTRLNRPDDADRDRFDRKAGHVPLLDG